jgi:allantoate deiminase
VDPEAVILQRLEALGRISEEPGVLTRTFGSAAMREANDLVQGWMQEAGMETAIDDISNLIGRLHGPTPDARILLIGSHLDTVRNAGKFDGPLGVLLGIACVERIRAMKRPLPFAIHVAAFADEEGVRFQKSHLGSRAFTRQLEPADLAILDANGMSIANAIRANGGDPARLPSGNGPSENYIGYIEPHIEQGPVLEERGLAVGVVTAIAGQTRAKLLLTGRPGHAGTTPMQLRRDALCGAAELILEVEKYARQRAGLVATVGQIVNAPNVSNVIPGSCEITLDVRHQDDDVRLNFFKELTPLLARIEQQRHLKIQAKVVQQTDSVPCSSELTAFLRDAVRKHQPEVIDLPSGAGHDAAILASVMPMAMLFVRCAGGISHHPDESVKREDIRFALEVLTDFVLSLAQPL